MAVTPGGGYEDSTNSMTNNIIEGETGDIADETSRLFMEAEEITQTEMSISETYARQVQGYQSQTTLTFSLMSDTHFHEEDRNAEAELETARMMGELGAVVDIDFIGNLGDMVRGNEAEEATGEALSKLVAATMQNANCPVFFLRGNHDDNGWYTYGNYGGTNRPDEIIDDEEWYQEVFNSTASSIVVDPNRPYGGYGYWDDEESKIRIFLLNSSDIPYILESDGSYRYLSLIHI